MIYFRCILYRMIYECFMYNFINFDIILYKKYFLNLYITVMSELHRYYKWKHQNHKLKKLSKICQDNKTPKVEPHQLINAYFRPIRKIPNYQGLS